MAAVSLKAAVKCHDRRLPRLGLQKSPLGMQRDFANGCFIAAAVIRGAKLIYLGPISIREAGRISYTKFVVSVRQKKPGQQ
jgi:hypothetical protein